jgi:hypothetical protein
LEFADKRPFHDPDMTCHWWHGVGRGQEGIGMELLLMLDGHEMSHAEGRGYPTEAAARAALSDAAIHRAVQQANTGGDHNR